MKSDDTIPSTPAAKREAEARARSHAEPDDLHRAVGRIEGRLETVVSDFKERFADGADVMRELKTEVGELRVANVQLRAAIDDIPTLKNFELLLTNSEQRKINSTRMFGSLILLGIMIVVAVIVFPALRAPRMTEPAQAQEAERPK